MTLYLELHTANKEELITYMSFFFVDIIGLSDPVMSTSTQVNKIKALNKLISECPTYANTNRDQMIVLPTGDGMAIGFQKRFDKPMLLSKELHLKLSGYNHDKAENEKVKVRIGCNDGHIFVVNDLYGNQNVWGPGIILARRVMDLGDADHILMTSSMAENLIELSDEYEKMLHPVHDFGIKHGQKILLYSVYGQNFGNSARPTKGLASNSNRGENRAAKEKIMEGVFYRKIELHYTLKDPESKLVGRRRTCFIKNNSSEPLFVLNETLSNLDKSISDIKLHLFDERKNELKISGIVSDMEKKVIIAKFSDPVMPNEDNRVYSMNYEAEEKEKCLIETLPNDCQYLNVLFEYPTGIVLEPRLFYIQDNKEQAVEHDVLVKSSGKYIARWKKIQGIVSGHKIRLEW